MSGTAWGGWVDLPNDDNGGHGGPERSVSYVGILFTDGDLESYFYYFAKHLCGQTIHLAQNPAFKTGGFKVLCTGGELEARDLPLCYEHLGACSRGALEGVRSLGNTGKSHVQSILGSLASATGQTNLFPTTHVYYHTILSLGQTTKT